ncbi:MAG: WD40 repeat domain-containing protein [Polyangiaceae bacterium]
MVAADSAQPGSAVVWDLVSGASRLAVSARTYSFTACAITKDGSRIAASGYDRRAQVFDCRTGVELHSFELRQRARALAFSPDDEWLLAGDDRVPRLFSLRGGAHRALKGHLSDIQAAAFSPNGRYVATAAGDAKIKLQDFAKAKVLATMTGYASMVAFPDDAHLLYAGFNCGAIVEVPTGKLVRELPTQGAQRVSLSGNGERLAFTQGDDGAELQVLELKTGAVQFSRSFNPIRCIALDYTGEHLVVARSAAFTQGTSLEVWSVSKGELIHPRGDGHTGGVSALAVYHRAGHPLLVSAAGRSLKIWEVESGAEIETIAGNQDIGALAISPDGRAAITTVGIAGRDHPIQCWDLKQLHVAGTMETDLTGARALAISPDGTLAAASYVRRAALFDIATRKLKFVLEKHRNQIDAIAFSCDGALVVTGAADKLVKIWSVATGKELHALDGHTGFVEAIVCLPDGTCVSASSHQLLWWDLQSGRRIAESRDVSELSSLAASPDGALLAVVSTWQHRVELWSLDRADQSMRRLAQTERLDDAPSSVVFASPRTLLVGTKRGRILKFDATREG